MTPDEMKELAGRLKLVPFLVDDVRRHMHNGRYESSKDKAKAITGCALSAATALTEAAERIGELEEMLRRLAVEPTGCPATRDALSGASHD